MSHAGVGLLSELADRSGLTLGLSHAMAGCGIRWHTHDPGVVLSHLAVAVADGADCLSDMAVMREQTELFGPVASRPTAWRAVAAVASVEQRGIVSAVAQARAKVWAAAGLDLDEVTLDFDATLIDLYSEKQDAAQTYKRGFGFHPFGVWCDQYERGARGHAAAGERGSEQSRTIISSFSTGPSTTCPRLPPAHDQRHPRRRGGPDAGAVRFGGLLARLHPGDRGSERRLLDRTSDRRAHPRRFRLDVARPRSSVKSANRSGLRRHPTGTSETQGY